MKLGFLVAATCAVACYSPTLQSPGYYCHADDVPACPGSQLCVNGRCVNGLDGGSGAPDLAMPRDMGGPTDGGGGSCAGSTTCATAASIPSINADTGGMQTSMGDTSQWLLVQTIENNSSLTGQRMRLRVSLASPASINFDLFVYRNGGGTVPECSAVTGSSTSTTATDVVSMDWGENDGDIPNGTSDDALVTIEVRAAASAMCSAGQRWSLEVKGGP